MSLNTDFHRHRPAPPLAGTPVLVLDCQATGPNPLRDRLLEVGWGMAAADRAAPWGVEVHTLRLAPEVALPRPVGRVTGLTQGELQRGASPRRVWKRLLAAKAKFLGPAPPQRTHLVIHFASYETPFLQRLHQICSGDAPFPFRIICTHQIARRLFPRLPRLGLRALAGYLGHPTSRMRRCRPHLAATAHIWRRLCTELTARGVESFSGLTQWLERPPDAAGGPRSYPMAPEQRVDLPPSPGVYRFIDSCGRPLYVGKAKSLKQRVNSYFQTRRKHPEHLLEMLTQAREVEHLATPSTLEAALAEWEEIRRLQPLYNIALARTGGRLTTWSADLYPCQPGECPRRSLGYFPKTDALNGLRLIVGYTKTATALERHPPGAACIAQMVGGSPERAPSAAILAEGLIWLRRRFPMLGKGRGLASFLTAGALWERAERKARLEAPTLMGTPPDPPREREPCPSAADPTNSEPWTPPAAGRALGRRLARCARLIRRAHWFALISESCLAWRTSAAQGPCHRRLIFSQGRILEARSAPHLQRLPAPPGWHRPHPERLCALTAEDVTRLRILTTEIKRLAADQRPLALSLGPGRIFSLGDLNRILPWL